LNAGSDTATSIPLQSRKMAHHPLSPGAPGACVLLLLLLLLPQP
jgi:hypothetical protein